MSTEKRRREVTRIEFLLPLVIFSPPRPPVKEPTLPEFQMCCALDSILP
jgi:hypothetical protein